MRAGWMKTKVSPLALVEMIKTPKTHAKPPHSHTSFLSSTSPRIEYLSTSILNYIFPSEYLCSHKHITAFNTAPGGSSTPATMQVTTKPHQPTHSILCSHIPTYKPPPPDPLPTSTLLPLPHHIAPRRLTINAKNETHDHPALHRRPTPRTPSTLPRSQDPPKTAADMVAEARGRGYSCLDAETVGICMTMGC